MATIFQKNLKAYLQIHNETYEDLASMLGVRKSSVSNWINGVSTPNDKKIAIMARHFNTTPDNLLHTDLEEQLKEIFLGTSKTRTETELLADFRNLEYAGQQYVIESVDLAKRKYGRNQNY